MSTISVQIKSILTLLGLNEKLGLSGLDHIVDSVFAICSKDQTHLESCIMNLASQRFKNSKELLKLITSLTLALRNEPCYTKRFLYRLLNRAVNKCKLKTKYEVPLSLSMTIYFKKKDHLTRRSRHYLLSSCIYVYSSLFFLLLLNIFMYILIFSLNILKQYYQKKYVAR